MAGSPTKRSPRSCESLPRSSTLRMWLLDVNMPRKIAAVLGEFGIEAETAESRGWNDLTNGELVAAAAGFNCLLTATGSSVNRPLTRFAVSVSSVWSW